MPERSAEGWRWGTGTGTQTHRQSSVGDPTIDQRREGDRDSSARHTARTRKYKYRTKPTRERTNLEHLA